MRTKLPGPARLIAKWILVLVMVIGGVAYGYLCGERKLPGYRVLRRAHVWGKQQTTVRRIYLLVTGRSEKQQIKGPWHPVESHIAPNDSIGHQYDELARLQALGYLSGYKTAPKTVHVTVNIEELAYNGLNLYTSGHAAQAMLMNMRGEILHRWAYTFADAFPDGPRPKGPESWRWWSRAHLDVNGDLLAIYDGYGIIKIDKDSNLIWATPGVFHHDLFVDEGGAIYCLTRKTRTLQGIHEYEPLVEDFITILDRHGNVVRNVSMLKAFDNSFYVPTINSIPKTGDLLHSNSIEILDGSHAERSSAFKRGNVLVSLAAIDVIAIINLEQEEVVWALTGQWNRQHDPTFLDNGNILLLDNLGHRGGSAVIELDPLTQSVVWAYRGARDKGFFTETFGTNQRLPNGNTLINESNSGRAFEVTSNNQIVWEFFNPARAGHNDELIATLFEFQRLPAVFPTDWLAKPSRY